MASPQGSHKLFANVLIKSYDFDPDGTDAVDVSWQDMRDFGTFGVVFVRTVGTSALDTFAILGNAASDGSGTDVNIKTHAVASEPNAAADMVVLECTAAELAQEGEDNSVALRYVSASCEFATGTDEGVVIYIFGAPRWAYNALTADIIA
tara:strand:- start:8345 stop:8794 length:450 start_codon:yes stop_codon:yes gene_type:complete